jgi:hypothetical protein
MELLLFLVFLLLLFLEKSRQKSVTSAIVRTMLFAPLLCKYGRNASAQKVQK